MIWYNKQTNAVMEALGTSKEGLTENEFKERLGQQGKNKLEEKRGKSFFEKIIEQISDFMVLTLLAAAAISFFISSMHRA